MELKGKRALVIGAGKSGIAGGKLLNDKGAVVTLYDGNEKLSAEKLKEQAPYLADCEIVIGEWKEELLKGTDVAVISPGVPTDLPFVKQIEEAGIPLWGEIELAYRVAKGHLLAITGTNGKTTTTALLGEIMQAYCKDVRVVGNIGTPYTELAADTTEESVTVAEISSFQLETADTFHPQICAILNITPDHLNRHGTMENYIRIKESITKNLEKDETCVLNYEDCVLREFGKDLHNNVIFFSSKRPLEKGLYYEDGSIYYAEEEGIEEVIAVSELNILGLHNYENVMAAVAMAESYGVPMEVIRETLRSFKAVEHRIEYVTEKRGVRFYNDSKGTNTDAAIQGIRAMTAPTLLIGGGYDKQVAFDTWIEAFDNKVKKLVLIGQTREKIADCARSHGFSDIQLADSLEEAIDICYANAEAGDAVLLSPACASWGMFDNYEQRGDLFKEYVRSLKE